jgi:hypothetical protein
VKRGGPPERRTRLERRAPLEQRSQLSRGRKPTRRRPVSEASPEQRGKVRAALVCVGCATAVAKFDPAHLVDRSLGGCDHADCVVPLCRTCHRAYDEHGLDLLPALEPRDGGPHDLAAA